ncbi:hypothetical protein GDO86_004818 [Hymenochirus boettgeri]|uniref:B30.2/SPRY domain-containing protein n=1 Tax=Hymenochirus boettgeri TaxID=247094 RepID=A0A8T2KCL8_9PIPI|nr:hypothetical protein GDO86_004818 [Hymenochirus boettgeri]
MCWVPRRDLGSIPAECRAEFVDSCPAEDRKLGNIAERFLSTRPERNDGTGISCTYCIHSPVLLLNLSALWASLCDNHLKVHSKSGKHVLTEPTTSFGEQKCSVHDELLVYYCPEDYTCVCVSCCLAGEHRGHQVALLSEAFENMKVKLGNAMGTLTLKREETERKVQVLQEHRREVEGKAAAETERVSALFRDIRERVESLEKRVLGEISRQEQDLLLPVSNQIKQLEVMKDELSGNIRLTEGLCSMVDPLCFLKRLKSGRSAIWNTERKDDGQSLDEMVSGVNVLDVGLICDMFIGELDNIVSDIKRGYCTYENRSMVLDSNRAGPGINLSNNRKTASCQVNKGHQDFSQPEPDFPQVFSENSFSSGRHYWDLDLGNSTQLRVGVSYPGVEWGLDLSIIGNNNKSWALCRNMIPLVSQNEYSVMHGGKETRLLSHPPSCEPFHKIRIFLDYEVGRLSFYELSDPVRHLHTFTATFTKPLHAAFWVGNGTVTITD